MLYALKTFWIMQLDGRRESTNVDDRRTSGGAVAGGLGIAGVVIAGLIYLLTGQQVDPSQFDMGGQTTQTNVEFSQEEQELASFAKKILAGTEDIWGLFLTGRSGNLHFPHDGSLYRNDPLRLRYRKRFHGAFLLLRGPVPLYRPFVLHFNEAAAWRRWRLRICVRHRA